MSWEALQAFLLSLPLSTSLFHSQLCSHSNGPCAPPPASCSSGWQPPKDFGLWHPAGQLRAQLTAALSAAKRAYWEAESAYFDKVTSISGGCCESESLGLGVGVRVWVWESPGQAGGSGPMSERLKQGIYLSGGAEVEGVKNCHHTLPGQLDGQPMDYTLHAISARVTMLLLQPFCFCLLRLYLLFCGLGDHSAVSQFCSPFCAGILKKVEKDERRGVIAQELAKFGPSRPGERRDDRECMWMRAWTLKSAADCLRDPVYIRRLLLLLWAAFQPRSYHSSGNASILYFFTPVHMRTQFLVPTVATTRSFPPAHTFSCLCPAPLLACTACGPCPCRPVCAHQPLLPRGGAHPLIGHTHAERSKGRGERGRRGCFCAEHGLERLLVCRRRQRQAK